VIVTVFQTDVYRAAGFVFSYGPAATVLEPDNLRELMHNWATAIAEIYKSPLKRCYAEHFGDQT